MYFKIYTRERYVHLLRECNVEEDMSFLHTPIMYGHNIECT